MSTWLIVQRNNHVQVWENTAITWEDDSLQVIDSIEGTWLDAWTRARELIHGRTEHDTAGNEAGHRERSELAVSEPG
jgi:hypothetical protein